MHIDIDSVKDEQKEKLTDKLGPLEKTNKKKVIVFVCV
jgi:hypothetical protein